MSLKAFRKIQVSNPEDTVGTAEAAVERVYGTMSFKEENPLEMPDEDRGSLARNMANDFFTGKRVNLTWTGDVNTRHIIWALCMAIRGNITPTQPDSTNEPNAYLWTIAPSLTGANTPDQANGIDTFTFEYGDDTQAYETEYCFSTKLEISGAPNQPCKFSCDITGRQRTDTTFTAALTEQSVQRFPFNLAKFYIDGTGAGLGTTQKTTMLKGFTWTLETMFEARFTADGNLYFSAVDEDKKKVDLSLVYVWGSDADSERTKYEDRTTTFPRIELLGATELDSGQSNVPYVRLDQAIRYTDWPELGDDQGMSTVEVTAESVYDSTWAKMFEVAVLTDLDAYPT